MRCGVTKCQAEIQVQEQIYELPANFIPAQGPGPCFTHHEIECFMYLFVLNSGTLDLEARRVCSQPGPGIIPPVTDGSE